MRRGPALTIALVACAGADRLDLRWPSAVLEHESRLLLVQDPTGLRAFAQPELEAPLRLDVDGDSAGLWLLLYDRPLAALDVSAGPLRPAGSQPSCELARPASVLRREGALFVESSMSSVPIELVRAFLAPEGARCVYAGCRLDARWLASSPPLARIVRVFAGPDERALVVDRSLGLASVDLADGQHEVLADQPGLPLFDARLVGDELFVLSSDGQISRGPRAGRLAPLGAPLSLSDARLGGLAVSEDAQEIFVAVLSGVEPEPWLELFRADASGHSSLLRVAVRSSANPNDKLSLEWLGPARMVGVYGGERLLELEAGTARLRTDTPAKSGLPLDLLSVLRRADGSLALMTVDGSMWTAPTPAGPWTERHGPIGSGVGVGTVAPVELDDGLLLPDLNSGVAFVHDEAGLCFEGVMPRVYVTGAARVGDRVLAGGYGQLGLIERQW